MRLLLTALLLLALPEAVLAQEDDGWSKGIVKEVPAEQESSLIRTAIARIDYSLGYSISQSSRSSYFNLRLATGGQSFSGFFYQDESIGTNTTYGLGWQRDRWSLTASRFTQALPSMPPVSTDTLRLDYRLPDLTLSTEYKVMAGVPTYSVSVSGVKIGSDLTLGISVAHTGLIEVQVGKGPWAVAAVIPPGGSPTFRLATVGSFNIYSK